ncbi:uncharacterized protein L201_007122 [Kwoniella dendrophila CBS 6074]|uniref:REJ domain-containing protein n=1 Tax=Kwoniella dendrophila CBS 6074 TaxID=1295534 RepID=A0AAX4K4R0_9TREE
MSTTLSRSPSPTLLLGNENSRTRKRSFSPAPSPAPFLTPNNPFECQNPFSFSSSTSASGSSSLGKSSGGGGGRPLPRRLLSLQSTSINSNTSIRSSPYQIPTPSISPISPISPINISSSSSSSSSSPSISGSGNGGCKPKRPNMNHRSNSFCATGSNSTYALACAPKSGHLSPDKRILVAPPLERTISSIGLKGNHSPPSQQMQRPFFQNQKSDFVYNGIENLNITSSGIRTPTRINRINSDSSQTSSTSSVLSDKDVNHQSNQLSVSVERTSTPTIPEIYVHSSTTPPRPSLTTTRNNPSTISNGSSRSASYTSTAILTPTTPHDLLFKDDQQLTDVVDDEENRKDEIEVDQQYITERVDVLMI